MIFPQTRGFLYIITHYRIFRIVSICVMYKVRSKNHDIIYISILYIIIHKLNDYIQLNNIINYLSYMPKILEKKLTYKMD